MTEPKYTPPEGKPWYGPNIQPGDLVSFEIDGVMHTDYYRPAKPIPRLSGWQRTVRTVTPQRWRKPLVRDESPIERHQRTIEAIQKATERLTNPKASWWRRLLGLA